METRSKRQKLDPTIQEESKTGEAVVDQTVIIQFRN